MVLRLRSVVLLCFFLAGMVYSDTDKKPAIRSACEVDYSPFCLVRDDGRADGFSVELMRAALKAMGRDVTFETGQWSEVRRLLERGEIDALPLVGRTPEREKQFDFTVPYLTMHGAIVVRKDTEGVRTVADLRGKRVGVMTGDNAEEYLRREARGLEIISLPTFTDAFRALSSGACDAVVIQRLVGIRLLNETGLTNLMIVDEPIKEFAQHFCFAVKEGDRDTLALLNEGLSLVVADGTYRQLHAKWFASLQIPSDRPIILGGDRDYPPFEFLDSDGRPAGFAVDLTKAIARQMNMNVVIRLGSWDASVEGVKNGAIDGMQCIFYSEERDRVMEFSPPYMVSQYVSVVRRDSGSAPATIEDLRGKSIAAQSGDVILEMLYKHGLTNDLHKVETQEEIMRGVSSGKYDTALVPRITALKIIDENDLSNLMLGKKSFLEREYCYAVSRENHALLAQFSEGLRIIKDTGEYREIYNKWMGDLDHHIPFRTAVKYVVVTAGSLIVAGIVVLGWTMSLRRQVAARTAELRQSIELQEAVFDAAADGMLLAEAETGRFVMGNAAMARMLRVPQEEISSLSVADIHIGDDSSMIMEKFKGQDVNSASVNSITVKRQDGSTFIADVNGNAITLDGRRHVLGAFRDVTISRQQEGQLRQSQKLEAIGTLAGGVAHEINNPINGILNYAQLILDRSGPDDPSVELAKEIGHEAERVAVIVRNLLSFARIEQQSHSPARLHDIVNVTLSLVRTVLRHDQILLEVDVSEDLPELKCRSQQIQQVLMNLVTNARDALNAKYPGQDDNKLIRITSLLRVKDGRRWIRLTVEDYGVGVSESMRERIFDPFYTTKPRDKGTGLGLSISHGIVKDHHGELTLESVVGEWTKFHVDLPVDNGWDLEQNKREV